MVKCPSCGSILKAGKVLRLTNRNSITCEVCFSKLRVRNTKYFSRIGALGGGLGAGSGALLIGSFLRTGNWIYAALFAVIMVSVFIAAWLLNDKYLELELVNSTISTSHRGHSL